MASDLSAGENIPVLAIEQRAVGPTHDQSDGRAGEHRPGLRGGSMEGAPVG